MIVLFLLKTPKRSLSAPSIPLKALLQAIAPSHSLGASLSSNSSSLGRPAPAPAPSWRSFLCWAPSPYCLYRGQFHTPWRPKGDIGAPAKLPPAFTQNPRSRGVTVCIIKLNYGHRTVRKLGKHQGKNTLSNVSHHLKIIAVRVLGFILPSFPQS